VQHIRVTRTFYAHKAYTVRVQEKKQLQVSIELEILQPRVRCATATLCH